MKASELFEGKNSSLRKAFDEATKNVSYTVLSHNRTIAKTVVVSDHCNVDIDEEGYPVGIETI